MIDTERNGKLHYAENAPRLKFLKRGWGGFLAKPDYRYPTMIDPSYMQIPMCSISFYVKSTFFTVKPK